MELSQIPLFDFARRRLSWLERRQEVLSQNVANADTPDYQPRDLKPLKFRDALGDAGTRLEMRTTRAGHLQGPPSPDAKFPAETERRPFETSPAGNAVVLEEQMAKVNETTLAHGLASSLYRKHVGLLRIALGERT